MKNPLLYSNKFLGDELKEEKEYREEQIYERKSIVNIDSSYRRLTPTNIYGSSSDGSTILGENPLLFNHNQSLIKIIHNNHPFKVDDKISINNVNALNVTLYNIISIKKNSQYIRIEHQKHGISLLGLYNTTTTDDLTPTSYIERLTINQTSLTTIYSDDKQNYILNDRIATDLYVTISGCVGNVGFNSNSVGNFIFDIPINVINKKQKIYPIIFYNTNTGTYNIDPDAYLIKLPKKASYNYLDGTTLNYVDASYLSNSNEIVAYTSLDDIVAFPSTTTNDVNNNTIKLIMLNLYNIPLNYIEADYPLSTDRRKGFHVIKSVGTNYYIIDVEKKANCINQNQFSTSIDVNNDDTVFNSGGGSYCSIRYINSVSDGYPSPSTYTISLLQSYKNVSQVKLLSSEFPNTSRLISGKIYWQNLNDGDYIYSVTITSGNYSPNLLANEIMSAMNKVIRFSYLEEEYPTLYTEVSDGVEDYKYHKFTVSVDVIKDITTFTSYREVNLINSRTITIPDKNIIVNLESHDLTSTDSFYLIVTDNYPIGLNINSSRRMYQYNSLTGQAINMSLNTKIVFISESLSVNTAISYSDLFFSTTNQLLVEVLSGELLSVGDFIFRTSNQVLYTVTEIIGDNFYAIGTTTAKIILGNTLINITTTPQSTYIFQSYTTVVSSNNVMIIYHKNNGVNKGDSIIVSNSTSVSGVSEQVINGKHTVADLISANEYIINLTSKTKVNSGLTNNIISIQYPDIFRLRFDFSDTFGTELGFRNSGDVKSITQYNSIITNLDYYEDDVTYNSVGISSAGEKSVLPLSGYNYLLISSKILSTYRNIDNISNVFAKILLVDEPGRIVYDTFVCTNVIREIPIATLSEIDFSFYAPDGTLYNFNNMNHSFTLEITELVNYAQDTNYNSRLNAITNNLKKI